MKKLFGSVAALTLVVLLLFSSMTLSQEAKKDGVIGAVAGAAGTKPPRIALPPNWSKLSLTEKQKLSVYDVRKTFQGKIADLNKQIDDVRAEERTELLKILTDDQKSVLKKMTGL